MKHWQQVTQEEMKKWVPDIEGDIQRLQKKLEIATKAMKDAIRDYEINGPCYEDCVGFYMTGILQKALTKMEEV